MSAILKKYTAEFAVGNDLLPEDTEEVFDALITESDEVLLADILRAWDKKGSTEDEIFQLASLMRDRCRRIDPEHKIFVDIVGTGGSSAKTFNVSTAAAFAVAGSGVAVAKHGNKAATSNSGSSDVLAELRVEAAASPENAERYLNELGICFMFAPNHHRLSPTLGKVRRGLGFPTVFNCVGPLCNPAGTPHQLIGVWNKGNLAKMAKALSRLGTKRSWIVFGNEGLDEISLSGPTSFAEIVGSEVSYFELSPEDLGVESADTSHLKASSPKESARMIENVLTGNSPSGPAFDMVLINAAAAISLTDASTGLKESLEKARASIFEGKAYEKLEALRKEAGV